MRSAWLLVLTGCWSEPPRPAAPAPAPRATATRTCSIRDQFDEQQPMFSVHLAIDGEVFAKPSALTQLELSVTGARIAKARVETSDVVLAGELDLHDVQVRPRTAHDGWLAVHVADVAGARGPSAHVVVTLPEGLAPRTVDLDVPCDDLTTIAAPAEDLDGAVVYLARGAQLLRTPAGGVVARVTADPLEVHSLDRVGDKVQVAVGGTGATVRAWVAASSITPPPPNAGAGWGTIGLGHYGTSSRASCSHDLALYVRSASRGEVHVGHIKAGRGFVVDTRRSTPEETAIELGGDIATYVHASELAACRP